MKINKKLLTGLIVIVLIAVAVFLFFNRDGSDAELPERGRPESRMILPDVITSSRDALPTTKPFVPKTAKEKRWVDMGMNMDMDDIRFYGRVIDQHGQPVVGAEVPFEIGGSAIGGSRGAGKKMTDANGEFSVETEGSSLTLFRITHPDIEFGYLLRDKKNVTWGYSHIRAIYIYGFQPQKGDNQILWTDTSPEKPYVFNAWRIGSGNGEVAGNLIEGQFKRKYKYNEFYTLNFTNSSLEILLEGQQQGQLKVIFERVVDVQDVTQRWEAKIIPVDGGIQITNDTYMNVAPESGYEPEIHIVREKTSPYENIDRLVNQQYYIRTNNGKIHGSLFVAFNANAYGMMSMSVYYKINPDGERILVQAKSKQ